MNKELCRNLDEMADRIISKANEIKKDNSEVSEQKIRECVFYQEMAYIDSKKILRLSVQKNGNKTTAILKDFRTDDNYGYANFQH